MDGYANTLLHILSNSNKFCPKNFLSNSIMNITRFIKSRILIPALILALVFTAFGFTIGLFPNKETPDLLRDPTVVPQRQHLTSDSKDPTTQRIRNPLFDNPNLSQNDSKLLEYLLERRLLPPKSNLKWNSKYSSVSPGKEIIRSIFGEKLNGTFIEAGANDGVFLSNTISLEKRQGWTGLLIEPNDVVFPGLKTSNRNAWIANVCLAVKPYPHKARILHPSGNLYNQGQGLLDPNADVPAVPEAPYKKEDFFPVSEKECFPLFSLLAAIKMTTVDLFSLDVQGVEYKILKAIPFDCVDIKVICVEHSVIPEGLPALKDLILSKGYDVYYQDIQDVVFIKNGYLLAGKAPK